MFRTVQKTLAAGLTGICCITIAAACFLWLSYALLTGLDDLRPLIWLTSFVAQSALTLFVLGTVVTGTALDVVLIAGAAGLVWLGWSTIDRTLSGPHFEGLRAGDGRDWQAARRAHTCAVSLAAVEIATEASRSADRPLRSRSARQRPNCPARFFSIV